MQRKIDLLRLDRQILDPHADGVINRVGDRRRDWNERAFADALGAEGAVFVRDLDGDGIDDGRHVAQRGLIS